MRSRVSAGTIGGTLALTASVAGFVSQAQRGALLTGPVALSIALVFAAGVLALARPRLVETLVAADALVALAMVMEVFGKLGLVYLPALLTLVFATMRAHEVPEEEGNVVTAVVQPMLAHQWDRLVADPPPAPESLRDVPAASGESLRRAG